MRSQEELFQLIHSLGKHEKRFFKLSASAEKGEKQYLHLFDIIARQSEYNADEICRELEINKNVLAVQKNYLQKLILECMTSLYSNHGIEVKKLLLQAEFLYSKGLYNHHKKILEKAKKLANHFEMRNQLLEILHMEHTLAWKNQNLLNAGKAIEEEKEILEQFSIERQYTHLANEILTQIIRMGDNRNVQDLKKINALMKNPLMRNEKSAPTFRAKYTLYHTHCSYHTISGNLKEQYRFAKKAKELYDENPEKIKYNTITYLYSIYNLVYSCNALKKYDEAKICIDMLNKNSHALTSVSEKTWAFCIFHENNLKYFIQTGRFEEGLASTEKLISDLNYYSEKMAGPQKMFLYFHIAKIFFGMKKYNMSLDWTNKIISDERHLRINPDHESNVKIFYLIVHFEKGNAELLPYLAKSLYRYLSSKQRVYKFESIILNFLEKKIFKIKTRIELIEQLVKLKSELLPLEKDPHEGMPFKEFDYISWLESKIENKSFSEIVRKKLQEQ